MIRSSGSQLVLGLGLAGFIVVVLLPLAALSFDALAMLFLTGGGAEHVPLTLTSRQLGLLASTVLFAGGVSVVATIIGVLAASVMWQWRKAPGVWLRWLVLPLVVIPPYVHAEAWINVFQAGGKLLTRLQMFAPQLSGWPGAVAVEVMSYLPVTAGLALLGLASVDPALVDAARIRLPGAPMLFRIILPLATPQIVAGGCVVFILSLADYSIPSLFQQNVYALELFVQFSQSGSPGASLIYALPLLATATAALCLALGGLREVAMRPLRGARTLGSSLIWPSWLKWLQSTAIVVLALQVLVPLVSLVLGTGSLARLQSSLTAAQSELHASLSVALIAGIACLPLALAVAVQLSRPGRANRVWWILAILPLAIPAPLVGIGLIQAWNNPVLGAAYGTAMMPVLASLARFTPFAALVLLAHYGRIEPVLFDAARVFQRSGWHSWLKIRLPLLAPGLAAAGCIVAALSLGELGATLLVAPPAQATLTMRIYNYMHYGSSASVAGLCLVMAASILLLGALAAWGFHSWAVPRKQAAAEWQ